MLDKFWGEGLGLLEFVKAKCYEIRPDYADVLDQEFEVVEGLKKFKFGSAASKENYEEVRGNCRRESTWNVCSRSCSSL